MTKITDVSILQAALLGYQSQLEDINQKIQDIRDLLRGRTPTAATTVPTKRHTISPEGRARISAAQRKRWAAKRKAQSGD